jgi:hypothetical protein
MDQRTQKGIMLILYILAAHVAIGVYAAATGGFFVFGLTAPERFLGHVLSGAEHHISVTGSHQDFVEDVCIQGCKNCDMICYGQDSLRISCSQTCSLMTKTGKILANEGQTLPTTLKFGFLFENATFKCYNRVCGFDIAEGNMTYSTQLPAGIENSGL